MLHPQGETDKEMCDCTGEHNENANRTSSGIFSGVKKRFKEQTANINNNHIWGKLLRADETSQGTLSSSSQEIEQNCRDFLTLSTRTPYPMRPESDVTATQDCDLENCFLDGNDINRVESSSELLPGRTVCERVCQGPDSKEREGENSLANDKDGVIELTADNTENGPLTVKERICNIDLSIEWIKSELTLMKAQSLSLMEQYEQIFGEIMDLKLRMEMEKDEELEPLLEEEMSFTHTRF